MTFKTRALALLHRGIDYLQAKFPPNRIVVLLTPLVFVPLAGSISAFVAEYFPGVELSEGTVIGFAAAGALSALTLASKWIDGWQAGEATADDLYNKRELRKAEGTSLDRLDPEARNQLINEVANVVDRRTAGKLPKAPPPGPPDPPHPPHHRPVA